MKNKIEEKADEWLKVHPNATLREAFVAGYLRSTDDWVRQEK